MRRLLMLALAATLGGCYTVDQVGFSSFVAQTVEPGMPMEEALVRMRTEGFACEPFGTGASCTRPQKRVMQGPCQERVELLRGTGKSLGQVLPQPIQCKPLFGKG